MRIVSALFFALIVCLCGCQQMGPTTVGVRFRNLPSNVGPIELGGVSSDVIAPGQLALLLPWDRVYTFNTAVQDVSWPSSNDQEEGGRKEGFVNTRALDGNEVALAVTVRYRVVPKAEKLIQLVQSVARNDAEVRELVVSIARADIRTWMNELKTSAFLDEKERFAAVDKVRSTMAGRVERYGIEIQAVILDDFRFERLLKDGTVDGSYQEKITQIQKLREDTERETYRKETVRAKKQEELNSVQAVVNRQIAEAEGYKQQAKLRGDGYFEYKSNEAKGVLISGKALVEGLKQQIEALSGPGATAILKLEIARNILAGNPKFIVLNQAKSGQGMAVQKLDTNEILQQLGVIEGLKEKTAEVTKQAADEKK